MSLRDRVQISIEREKLLKRKVQFDKGDRAQESNLGARLVG